MRRMSFSLTKKQIRERTKTVTRRMGWDTLKSGERFLAVEKCMGLKKGEKHKILGLCECVSNHRERLKEITQNDVRLEGFPELRPEDFISLFWRKMRCHPNHFVNRIEFKYVDQEAQSS